jgi:hypothetical protein
MYPKSSNTVRSFVGGFSRHHEEFSLVLLVIQELEAIGCHLKANEC